MSPTTRGSAPRCHAAAPAGARRGRYHRLLASRPAEDRGGPARSTRSHLSVSASANCFPTSASMCSRTRASIRGRRRTTPPSRASSRRAGSLRQRRLRLGAPRAFLDGSGRAPAAGLRGTAAAGRAGAPGPPARRCRQAVRPRHRRRQGGGQARCARASRRARRHRARRRQDGRGAAHAIPLVGAHVELPSTSSPRRRSQPMPRPRSSRPTTFPTAGSGSTSGPTPASSSPV